MSRTERLARILERLSIHRRDPSTPMGESLCAAAVDILALPGAGITFATGDEPRLLSVAASTPDMERLHELELAFGEGPCIEAFTSGWPRAEIDLASSTDPRWFAFAEAALRTEARAVFGFPMALGPIGFGALNLYATRPGALTIDQAEDASLLADVALHGLLAGGDPLDSPDSLARNLLDLGVHQAQVHQATGMVAVQLSTGVADAFARLRAGAFAEDRPVSAVAAEVVGRRLRFEP